MRNTSFAAHLAALALTLGLAGCGNDDPISGTTMQTLSNRADLVSGGAALVQVNLPQYALSSHLRVDVDGTDVTSSFVTQSGCRQRRRPG